MNIQTAIETRRTIRRYKQTPVPEETLKKLVDLARLHASGGNLQPIRYGIVCQKPMADAVFPHLRWAAYLPDYKIEKTQQPPAYLLLLQEERGRAARQFDVGAAATTIMLAARKEGLDTCCLGAIDRPAIKELLGIPENLYLELVIAIGYADEKSRAVAYDGSVKYYQEEDGNLCVPKYGKKEVLIYSDSLEK